MGEETCSHVVMVHLMYGLVWRWKLPGGGVRLTREVLEGTGRRSHVALRLSDAATPAPRCRERMGMAGTW